MIKREFDENGLKRLYYNIDIKYNPDDKGATPLRFDATRSEAIIKNPRDYYLTITRFTMPGNNVPLFIFPIQIGQSDPNKGIMSVSLEYDGLTVQKFLDYVTTNPNDPIPSPPLVKQDLRTRYYYVYSYPQFINIVNKAFSDAFTDLKAAKPAMPQTEAPYYIFDADTEKISLISQFSYSQVGACKIWIKYELEVFMEAIYSNFHGVSETDGKDINILITDKGNNAYAKPGGTIPTPPTDPDYLEMKQDYSTADRWNSLQGIVITSNGIPVNKEKIQIQGDNGVNSSVGILTDFEPSLDKPGDTRSTIRYFPQGPYRLIEMNGNHPMTSFDFEIFWQTKDLQLFPLSIGYNQTMTIKFMFIRKDAIFS